MEGRAKKRRICENDGTAGGASSTHTSTEGQGMDTSSGYDYEVFLSFRGPDTRAGFTDFLYTSLKDAGIRVFKDDEELRVGEEFAPELLQAINQSKISIPIFSTDYASSVWCLKELVQMVECQKTGRQKIMPIFYNVAPSEVRYQTGGYAKAFLAHEEKKRHDKKTMQEKKRHDKKTMQEWKDALTAVGALNGWDLHSQEKNSRREGEFAKKLTKEVFRELKKAYLVVSDFLVSVDNHVDAIMEKIGAETSETRIIGIHGMGGIGKTTIAKIIYNQLSKNLKKNFEGCCFLSNVRETSKLKGIHCLQDQLITDILHTKWTDIRNIDEGIKTIEDRLSNKRVLLLLDDVEEKDHMKALVGNHDWFGKGSKIIITTRNKDVLNIPEVDDLHEVKIMDSNQSLQLFSKHAFRRDSPLDEYIIQSNRAIGICGGLPLALEVIGSLLSLTKKEEWDGKLKVLENVPPEKVQSKLKISYNALRVREKHIFLDIACLFIGYDKDIVVHFWDESKFFLDGAMEVLQNMSLIRIEKDNKVWMHDQLRDLGREIVREESGMKIKKQSRVWDPKKGLDLLRKHKGNKEVEALRLKLDHQQQYRFTYEGFESLSDLRFLEVGGSMNNFCAEEKLLWHESPSNVPPDNENSYLLPQLRWFSWRDIPPRFDITNFSMEDVVILDLSESKITHYWKGWSHMKVMKILKVLNLTNCHCLERTPNFSALVNLERLILQGCSKLVEIDGSISQLKHLVSLDVRDCWHLRRLLEKLGGLEALKELRIDETEIEKIPNCQGMRNLRIFTASKCLSFTLPPTIGDLTSLEYLSLKSCKQLKWLPDSVGNLKLLIELDISKTSIRELPDSIGNLENLKVVKMTCDSTSKIPNSFWTIEKLEEIEVTRPQVTRPQVTRPRPTKGFYVKIGDCIHKYQSLRILKMHDARIYVVPQLSKSLVVLQLEKLYMKTFPDLSDLTNLKSLCLEFGPRDDDGPVEEESINTKEIKTEEEEEEESMPWIGKLSKLEILGLTSDYVTTLPKDITLLHRLQFLIIRCRNLRCVPSLPSSLLCLGLESEYVTTLPTDLSLLPRLQELDFKFPKLPHLPSLPSSLLSLHLESEYVTTLPTDLSLLPRLQDLYFKCPKLPHLPSLPSSLSSLFLFHCYSLCSMEDLSNLKRLSDLEIIHGAISEIRGLNCLENLQGLKLWALQQVEILPELSNFNKLRSLQVGDCYNLVEISGQLPQSLEELEIFHCKSLRKLPDLSSLKGLQKLDIVECGKLVEIQLELPQSLKKLQIGSFGYLQKFPDLSSMKELREVVISGCDRLVEIQGELPLSLEELGIYLCKSLEKLPNLSSLKGLQKVTISDCPKLPHLPSLPSSLLSLHLESEYVTTLPTDLSLLPRLQDLYFKCPKLPHLPSLPSSLSSLILFHCYSLCSMEDLSNLKRLSDLQIIHGEISEIRGLDCLENLQRLKLWALQQVEILPELSNFNKLRSLQVGDCDNLVEISGQLPQSLEELDIFSCESLRKLPDLSSLKGLQKLDIVACGNLVEIQLELPQSLKKLQIDSFGYLQKFPDLSSMKELRKVVIGGCDRLVEIQGELPLSLEELRIYLCKSLETLPNLSSLKGLQKVTISDCGKLDVEAISRLCSEKSIKFVGEDEGEDDECEYEDEE